MPGSRHIREDVSWLVNLPFSMSTPLSVSLPALVVIAGVVTSWVSQESCPSPRCRCLDGGSIMACQRSRLTKVPGVLNETLILDLDQNRISLIQNGSFRSGFRLEMVSLQDNGLIHLEPDSFAELLELRILRLGRNRLSTIPVNLFRCNRRLLVLDLHGNHLTGLPDGAMYHVHSLQSINVSFNQLATVSMGTGFRFTTQLSNVDLSGNDLVSLESTSFSVAHFWDQTIEHHVNLSYCNIRYIHPSTFQSIPFIRTLSLQGNPHLSEGDLNEALKGAGSTLQIINLSHLNISDLRATFLEFRPRGLVELDLSHNRIGSVPKRTFHSMENLRWLDLSHNNIRSIQGLADELPRLERLDLSYNDLNRIEDSTFEGLRGLTELDLSRNSLIELSDGPFLRLTSLRFIDLGHNRLELVSFRHSLDSVESLRVTGNRISCLQFLRTLGQLRYLDISQNAITRLDEELFPRGSGQRSISVNLSSNAIHRIAKTAFRFVFYDYIDLSFNRITTLDYFGWENVRRLYAGNNLVAEVTKSALNRSTLLQDLQLHSNRLTQLPVRAFGGLLRLKVLDLGDNPIGGFLERGGDFLSMPQRLEVLRLGRTGLRDIPSSLLRNLTSLRLLDLSQNRLERIDENAFSHLTRLRDLDLAVNLLRDLAPNLLAQAPSLKNLDLSGNVLDCSCRLVALWRQFLSPGGSVPRINLHNGSSYKCHSPLRWTGTSLDDFYSHSTSSSSCPVNLDLDLSFASSTLRRIAAAASVVVAGVIVVIIIVVVVIVIVGCRQTDGVLRLVAGRRRTRLQGTARYECVEEESSRVIEDFMGRVGEGCGEEKGLRRGEGTGVKADGMSRDESKEPIIEDSTFSAD